VQLPAQDVKNLVSLVRLETLSVNVVTLQRGLDFSVFASLLRLKRLVIISVTSTVHGYLRVQNAFCIAKLLRLQLLRVSQCLFGDLEIEHLVSLSNLRKLSLSKCAGLSNVGILLVSQIKQLSSFVSEGNLQVTDLSPLQACRDLQELKVSPFVGIPHGLNLKSMLVDTSDGEPFDDLPQKLEKLDFRGFWSSQKEAFGANLTHLTLYDTDFSPESIKGLSQLQNLQDLTLSGDTLDHWPSLCESLPLQKLTCLKLEMFPAQTYFLSLALLGKIPMLREIWIHGFRLNTVGWTWLGKQTQLTVADLWTADSATSDFFKLTNLKVFFARVATLSSRNVVHVQKLRNLCKLDLSDCMNLSIDDVLRIRASCCASQVIAPTLHAYE